MRRCAWQSILLLVAFMAGCNGASGPENLEQGITALGNKQYDDAVKLLTKATERMPKSAEAYNYLGAAYQGKGEQTPAVRAFEKSIALNPNYPPPRFNLGVICFERQQYARAIEHLTKFVALQPNQVEGCFYLASAQFQTEDLRGAYPNYLKVVESDPNRPEVLNNLGVISAKLGQTHEAETWFNSCLKTDPKYSPAFLNIAILDHHTLNKPVAALDYYQKFLDLEPAGPSSEMARQAIAQLKRTPNLAPSKPTEGAAAKSPIEEAKQPEIAEETRLHTVTTEPKPTPPSSPIVSDVVTPTPVATPATVEQATTTPPTLTGPRWKTPTFPKPTPGRRDAALTEFNRGAQYQKDKLLDAAIHSYRDAIKLDPTFFSAYYNLGTALQAQGMANQAIDAYQRVLSLQPSFNSARLNLGILFEQQGYLPDAADQYEAILRDAPNDAAAHLSLGRVYSSQDATKPLARQHYQRFLDLAPNNPDAKRVKQWLQEAR